ncbi:MAG: glycosyltransferase [Lachnospiraceae bacterium]|nr:glycosyltransferase [Lachnospiraceae bacterium]
MDTDNRMFIDEVNFKKPNKKYKVAATVSKEILQQQRDTEFDNPVKLSVLLTLTNNDEDIIRAMIDSILNQSYANYEVSILDVTDKAHAYLGNICKEITDERFKYTKLKKNYTAFEILKEQKKYINGEYCVFMECSDILMPNAFYECVKAINEKNAEFVYSDNGLYDVRVSNIIGYNIKPDYSLYNLEFTNYIRSFSVVETRIFMVLLESGELGKELSKDDITSILSAISSEVVHIRKPLYNRKRFSKKVNPKKVDFVTQTPLISVIMLNKDNSTGLKSTIEGLKAANYNNFEVLIVEAETTDINTVRYYKELSEDEELNVRFFRWKKEYIYSKMLNYAVGKANGQYVIIVEPTLEFGEGWLKNMLYYATQDDVALVAPALYDKKGNAIDKNVAFTKNVSRVSLECAIVDKNVLTEVLADETMDYVQYSQLISDKIIELGYQNIITTKSIVTKKSTLYKKVSKGTPLEYDAFCEDYY